MRKIKRIKIKVETGDTFIDRTFGGLVRQMSMVYPRGETKREYMNNVKKRAVVWDESRISVVNPETFIKELYRIGIINTLEIEEE